MLPPVTLQSSDFQEPASAPSCFVYQRSTVNVVISALFMAASTLGCMSRQDHSKSIYFVLYIFISAFAVQQDEVGVKGEA